MTKYVSFRTLPASARIFALGGLVLWFLCLAPPLVRGEVLGAPLAALTAWEEGRVGGLIEVPVGERRAEDIHVVGGTVRILGELEGDVQVVWGTLVVAGKVDGDVQAVGGTLEISGQVDGDVEAVRSTVRLGDGARIQGELTTVASDVHRGTDVMVRHHQRVDMPRVNVGFPFVQWNLGMGLLGLLILVLIASLFPGRVERMALALDEPARWLAAPFVGLAALVLVLLASITLCATVIGILLVPFLLLAFWLSGYYGLAAFYLAIGRRLMAGVRRSGARGLVGPVVLAYLLFRVVGMIPCISAVIFLLGWVLCLFGVGLAVLTAFGEAGGWSGVGSRRRVARAGQAGPPPAPPVTPVPSKPSAASEAEEVDEEPSAGERDEEEEEGP